VRDEHHVRYEERTARAECRGTDGYHVSEQVNRISRDALLLRENGDFLLSTAELGKVEPCDRLKKG